MAIDNRNPLPELSATSSGQLGPGELLRLDDLHVTVHHGAATAVRGVSLPSGPARSSGWSGSPAAARP